MCLWRIVSHESNWAFFPPSLTQPAFVAVRSCNQTAFNRPIVCDKWAIVPEQLLPKKIRKSQTHKLKKILYITKQAWQIIVGLDRLGCLERPGLSRARLERGFLRYLLILEEEMSSRNEAPVGKKRKWREAAAGNCGGTCQEPQQWRWVDDRPLAYDWTPLPRKGKPS